MGDWYVKQTIGRLPERAARQWGPREALAFQGRRWTFAQMHARVDAAAKGLLSLGIAPGDKVALWMVNRPEWIDAMFAIIKIGAVLVPVNTRFRTEDMVYILAQSDAAAVLLTDRSGSVDYFGMMREVVPALGSRPDTRFPCLRHVVVLSEGPLMSMVRGARQVLTETFDAGQCLDLIASERATIIHGFDTHYSSTASTRTTRSCWTPRSEIPAPCRACARASAPSPPTAGFTRATWA
jgi:acyl-coenzyme A synthetase/AMP-(fatty) acid ligase